MVGVASVGVVATSATGRADAASTPSCGVAGVAGACPTAAAEGSGGASEPQPSGTARKTIDAKGTKERRRCINMIMFDSIQGSSRAQTVRRPAVEAASSYLPTLLRQG